MVICVNPKSADYDETMNVLQFAEMAQEIEIERVDPIQRNFAAMTPARQKVQDAYLEAMNRNKTNVDVAKLNPEYSPIYSLGPAIPPISSGLIDDEEALAALERHIDQRLATRNTLVDDHKNQRKTESNLLHSLYFHSFCFSFTLLMALSTLLAFNNVFLKTIGAMRCPARDLANP